MKALLVALALVVAAVMLPTTVSAQDFVMEWTSTVNVVTTATLTGTSPATLTPVSGGLPPTFSTQAYNLSFSYLGHTFGGLVAQGSYQDPGFSVPSGATGLPVFGADFSSGTFNLTGDTFTLHSFIGAGHNNAEFTATGTRSTTTASTVEPGVLLVSAAGLVSAAIVRRAPRS
jgi:hypothetical protein